MVDFFFPVYSCTITERLWPTFVCFEPYYSVVYYLYYSLSSVADNEVLYLTHTDALINYVPLIS